MAFWITKLIFIINNSIFILMDIEFKTTKKEIYIPLKKILETVIKRLKEFDIHVPLGHIGRMDLNGRFQDESLVHLRKYIYDYLKLTNKFKSSYFNYMKKTKVAFDSEMAKDGSFAPGFKQYDSLKNQLSDSLLKTDGKVWIMSYDQYLPTIREHSNKRSKHPRAGKEIYKNLNSRFDKQLKEINKLQKIALQKSRAFHKNLGLAMKNPNFDWQELIK